MLEAKAVVEKPKAAAKPAVIVKNVTKAFAIPHERKTTLFENLKGAFRPSTYETFTALEDVSFTVERGESVGIIGDNGSGKSTLLKIISKILRPTSGRVEVNGRITPFLELGVGFQPDLTARENVEVYSTIMGLSDREIAGNIDNVLEFAGLAKFRDTKLKNFSSGMQVRLAFATAIQKEPDILLVDEVLAVGDMDFQRKCYDIFQRYKDNRTTILFVSHDLSSIRRFCDKALLLNKGRAIAFEDTGKVIDKYIYKVNAVPHAGLGAAQNTTGDGGINNAGGKKEKAAPDEEADSIEYVSQYRSLANFRWGNKILEITDVRLMDKNGNEGNTFMSGDPATITMKFKAKHAVEKPIFGFSISDEKGDTCYGTNTMQKGMRIEKLNGEGTIKIMIDEIPLLQGKYTLSVAAQSEDCSITYDWHSKKYGFYVVNSGNEEGSVKFKCDFEVSAEE